MRGQGNYDPRQTHALRHPIRLRIVELFTTDAARSLAVRDLTADLGDGFKDVGASQVHYHLRELQRVNLIPA